MPSVNYAIITIRINGVSDQMIVEKQHDITMRSYKLRIILHNEDWTVAVVNRNQNASAVQDVILHFSNVETVTL